MMLFSNTPRLSAAIMIPPLCLLSSTLLPVTMRCLRTALSDLAREHIRKKEDAAVRGATVSGEALFEGMEQCELSEGKCRGQCRDCCW